MCLLLILYSYICSHPLEYAHDYLYVSLFDVRRRHVFPHNRYYI